MAEISEDNEIINKIRTALEEFGASDTKHNVVQNPWVKYFSGEYRCWNNNTQPWMDIADGTMKKMISQKMRDIVIKISDCRIQL